MPMSMPAPRMPIPVPAVAAARRATVARSWMQSGMTHPECRVLQHLDCCMHPQCQPSSAAVDVMNESPIFSRCCGFVEVYVVIVVIIAVVIVVLLSPLLSTGQDY